MAIRTMATPRATSIEWIRRSVCMAQMMARLKRGGNVLPGDRTTRIPKQGAVSFAAIQLGAFILAVLRELSRGGFLNTNSVVSVPKRHQKSS